MIARRPTTITRAGGDTLGRAYDRAGNVTAEGRTLAGISGDAGSGTQAFTYDGLGRLTGSSGLAVARSYRYDLDGNRTSKTEGAVTTSYTFDRTDALVSQDNGVPTSFTYDPYGNLTGKAESASTLTAMTYDAVGRLTAITPASPATSAVFTLDALGRHRTRVLSAGGTDTYAYLGSSETVHEISNSATGTTRSLLDIDGTRLAIKAGASAASFTLFDALGSLVGLVDGARTITGATRYDGYGETVATTGTTGPWRFRGTLDLSPTSAALYEMGARYYAPSLGAFTQADTYAGSAANPASMNRFLYAEANPATLIDPTGHNAIVEDGVIIREAGLYSAQQNRHNRFTRYRAPTHGSRTLGQVTSRWRARGLASEIDSQWSRTRPRPVGSPTTTWRNKYNAVIADFNSRLTPLDEHGLLVEAVMTHEARTGYASTPYTFRDALDNLGMLPVLGTPADIASAIGYAREGDLGMAGLSVLGILSIGDAIKAGRKGAKALDETADVLGRFGDDAAGAAFQGGRWKDLSAPLGIERHHMPADSVSPLSRGLGPAIQMDALDHALTASWGPSSAAKAYRQQLSNLVAVGHIDDAIQMDIDNVRELFGPKYDDAILQMIGSLPTGW